MYGLVPKGSCTYNTQNQDKIETYYCRTDLFKYSFFLYSVWNKVDVTVRNAKSFLIFKNLLLKIGRPIQNSMFKIHDPLGIKLLTRLRVGLSHINEHWFRHNFQDCLNPLCSCSLEVESNIHFFLHCQHFIQSYQITLDSVKKIVHISNLTDDALVKLLLYGSLTFNFEENRTIIKASIK